MLQVLCFNLINSRFLQGLWHCCPCRAHPALLHSLLCCMEWTLSRKLYFLSMTFWKRIVCHIPVLNAVSANHLTLVYNLCAVFIADRCSVVF